MQFLSLPLPFLPDSTDFPQLFLLFSTVVLPDNRLLFTQWVFCHVCSNQSALLSYYYAT
ncbi:hypothetical protein [Nostoc sp.]|uniref:hypothetical protein n=1 Tax=Nostoc sp. TaxID=1180 RepID=UPI002FF29062